tara:strand:- start:3333 stop:5555 length:2223 start_codon:yes stop_codon:yes gene_type:complete
MGFSKSIGSQMLKKIYPKNIFTFKLIFFLLMTGLNLVNANTSYAERNQHFHENVLLFADEVIYDDKKGIIKAQGNVEISQAGKIIIADSIVYRRNNDELSARGNVTLMEPSGEVAFANYVKLKDQMKEGILDKLLLILNDNSRISANSAKRINGTRTEMNKAVYSPCELCPENPDEPPLWQIKAMKVIHDLKARDIAYRDAWIEFYGMPFLYTPYFQHPDPTVDRRSGFLAPSYSNSSSLGFELTTPYYWNISPEKDATFAPSFYTDGGAVLSGEYREHLGNGEIRISPSITYTDKLDDDGNEINGNEFRGHLFSDGHFEINDIWEWGYKFERASDDTYLRRYRIKSEDTLLTNPYIEGLNGSNYAAANAYFFQGLEENDDQGQIPFVFPLAEFSHISKPGWEGSYRTLKTNLMLLQRLEGTDSRRFSIEGSLHLPTKSKGGHLWTGSLNLRADLYHVNNVINRRDPLANTSSGLTGRIRPTALLEWRYPLIKRQKTVNHILEPVVQGIFSPYGGNPVEIPNEDSQNFEFNDSNLFSKSRFTGLDRLESGPRINYGIRYGAYGASGGRTTALIGQSARLKDDDTFGLGSGLEDHYSDYVGRLMVEPSNYFSLAYRFRLDKKTIEARRNEITLRGGPDYLKLHLGYALLDEQLSEVETSGFANREEMVTSVVSKFTDFWSISADLRRNLTGSGGTVSWSSGLTYEDECFLFVTKYGRTFTRDREVEPDDTLIFKVLLKNLG